ncbi:glycosyltransferase [Pelagicoccus sp. SDUM812003]|uniref:glycosyltransferase n=1 Tax=Pelagicoccus sp. SDUM812003 TaxID=3041267 RepID=UPI00280F9946|nr:glycosyltransferase [Pelagicoccus sp. SDUM812003]MDQ8204249.1 glycosyltransferase [Pelagicoccus sp. SDUM812003]
MKTLKEEVDFWIESNELLRGKQCVQFEPIKTKTFKCTTDCDEVLTIKEVTDLTSRFPDIERLYSRFADFVQRPLGRINFKNKALLVSEFVEGTSVSDLYKEGVLTRNDVVNVFLGLLDRLDDALEFSTSESRLREIIELEESLHTLVESGLLISFEVTSVVSALKELIDEEEPMVRFSPGDLIAQNIIIRPNGEPCLIDLEYTRYTHFYKEDTLRFVSFSNIDFDRENLIDRVKERPSDATCLYMWLKQISLEALRLQKSTFGPVFGHNLSKIYDVLNKNGFLSKLGCMWQGIGYLKSVACRLEEENRNLTDIREKQLSEKDFLYRNEIDRISAERDQLLDRKDKAYQEEIERIIKERDCLLTKKDEAYTTEIERIGAERDRLLLDKDISYRNEIDRIIQEREQLLSEKDKLYQLEIKRISLEREKLLLDKDQAYQIEIKRLTDEREELLLSKDEDYQAEIKRIGVERDSMLADKDRAFREEIDRLVKERDSLLQDKDSVYQGEIVRIRDLHAEETKTLQRLKAAELDAVTIQFKAERQQIIEHFESLLPEILVIVVDYNGAHYLDKLFLALKRQTFKRFRISLVVNGDYQSCEKIALCHRDSLRIDLIVPERNVGFASGNNLAYRNSSEEFVALLNNDTIPEDNWLYELYREIMISPDIAAVNSKILFNSKYAELRITSPTFTPSEIGLSKDSRELGVFISIEDEDGKPVKVFSKGGLHDKEVVEGREFRWTNGEATIWIPANSHSINLYLRTNPQLFDSVVQLKSGDLSIDVVMDEQEKRLSLSELLRDNFFDVINNAGSYIKNEREVGDIGIFEKDIGQYNDSRNVDSVCGCSILLRRRAVGEDIFPNSFFAYFEDTDLSWRLRKQGFRLRYTPRSVVRHIHGGSAGERSPFFNYHVYRNYRWLLVRNCTSYVRILYLIFKELRDYFIPVGGLSPKYNSVKLKKDTIRGMFKYLFQRLFGKNENWNL